MKYPRTMRRRALILNAVPYAKRRRVQHEFVLQRSIWQFLKVNNVFAWIDYQPLLKPGQRSNFHFSSAGVADILGIYQGKPLAIEVKYGKNKTTGKQDFFLESFRKAGGIAFVARSLEDVARELNLNL